MPIRIGIVDDSELAVSWAQRCLERAGFEVVCHSESFGVQAFVRQKRPQVLLLDINMPALKGDSLCRLLKSKQETKGMTVLLYSSLPEKELQERVISCGADGYVAKTPDAVAFISTVQSRLARLAKP